MQLPAKDKKQQEALALRDKEMKEFYEEQVLKDEKGKPLYEEKQVPLIGEDGKPVVDEDGNFVLGPKRKLLTDNFEYKTENIVDEKGKVVSKKKFKGGYRIVLND